MPWKVRRQFYLIMIAALVIGASVFVFIRDSSIDTKLLSGVGFALGLSIIINILPSNGHEEKEGKE